ncbi:MAG: YqgE/AlgH family protein [Nitratireductor sp.]|nr:YqgE/AlgH family protein [Nitratireductor sp.]
MIRQIETLQGQFLIAMPNMGDTRFEKTVIYLCAHSADGAMGFVINRTLETPTIPEFLHQLNIVNEEERDAIPASLRTAPLYSGGPVEPGRGFVLHSPDYSSETTLAIDETISLTATLEILRAISFGRGPGRVFLALGYSGWAAGQLEEEIAANGWLTCQADPGLIFDRDQETKYSRALRAMGINPLLLSAQAGHA